MDYGTKIEQQEEIIEHFVTQSRRILPCGPGPEGTSASISVSSPIAGPAKDVDRRYYATGERDCSRETSMLQTSGICPASRAPVLVHPSAGTMKAKERTNIDSYGYDVHEVHTSEGGARIVQTHGSGLINPDTSSTIEQRDMSFSEQRRSSMRYGGEMEQLRKTPVSNVGYLDSARSEMNGIRPKVSDKRPSIYTVAASSTGRSNDWRQTTGPPDDSTIIRKDSYKRMQMGQQDESTDPYLKVKPRSDASLMIGADRSQSQKSAQSLTRWNQLVHGSRKMISRARNITWTPRLVCLCLLFCVLVTMFFVLLALIFNAIFTSYSVRTISLYPPICEDCRRRAPNGIYEQSPSVVHLHFYSPSQVHLELIGNPPFKSNSFTAIDFESGFVAIADHALVDVNGQHIICFLMNLDKTALPSISALRDALSSIGSEVHADYGWQEYWQYHAEPIDGASAQRKFTDKIADCQGARWYFLKHTVYTKDSSCSDCYDFCLPDYGIQRLHKYEDDITIGIRRLNCFRLYVAEWARFENSADSQGGHWSYPKIIVNTQRDSHGNWVS